MVDLLTEFLDSLQGMRVRPKDEPPPSPPVMRIGLPGPTREAVQRQIDVLIRFVDRGGGHLDINGPVRMDDGTWGALVDVHEVEL